MSSEDPDSGAGRSPRRRRAAGERRAALSAPEPAAAAERDATRASPALRLLNVGYGNFLLVARVVAIVSPQSSPMKRLREEASSRGKLVDAKQGRRTRSILVTDSDHVILSALNPETIAARLGPGAPVDAGP